MKFPTRYIKVETRTLKDVFGTVVYKITDEKAKTKDGEKIKCIIMGGTGPSAKAGYPVYDLDSNIQAGVEQGKIKFITEEEACDFVSSCEKQ